jgi:hypothetical protein
MRQEVILGCSLEYTANVRKYLSLPTCSSTDEDITFLPEWHLPGFWKIRGGIEGKRAAPRFGVLLVQEDYFDYS